MTTPKSQSDDLLLNGSSESHKGKSFWPPAKIASGGASDPGQYSSTPSHSNEELGGMIPSHQVEIVRLNVIQKNNNTLFTVVTLPTISTIPQVLGETQSGAIYPQYRIASANGETSGFNFDESTRLPPGYYCLGFVFKSKEEVDSIISLRLTLHTEPISNFAISQILFELYRSLGFEPSQILGYPIKPSTPSTPFYRKTRSELGKLEEHLIEKIGSLPSSDATLQKLEQLVTSALPSDEIIKRLDQLAASQVSSDAILQKLDQLEKKLTQVPSDDLIKRLDQLEKNTPSDEIIKRLDQLATSQVSSPPSDEIIKRLDQLAASQVSSPPSDEIIKRLDRLEKNISSDEIIQRLDRLEKNISSAPPSDELIKRLDRLEQKIPTNPIVPFTPTPIIQKLDQLEKKLSPFDPESLSKRLETSHKLLMERLAKLEQSVNGKDDLIERLEEYQRHVISREQPEKGTHSVSLEEIETIISERNMYLEKLKEAEDYIDELLSEEQTPSHSFHLSPVKGGRK